MKRYSVTVKPSRKQPSVQQDGDHLTVAVDAPPHDNEANVRLIEILADHFSVAPSRITIRRGATSRIKRIEIA